MKIDTVYLVIVSLRLVEYVFSVGNVAHTNFICQLFHIPLKNSHGAKEGFTEKELYNTLATAFAFVFLDLDPAKSFGLRAAAAQGTQALSIVVRDTCKAVKEDCLTTGLKHFLGLGETERVLSDYGCHMIQRLFESGNSVDEVVSTILPTVPAAVAT